MTSLTVPVIRRHCGECRLRLFELFPVLLAIIVTWIYGIIMTEAGAYNNSSAAIQAACRTDKTTVLKNSPWVRFPYPGQWGAPTFSVSSTFVMLAGALSAMVESVCALSKLKNHPSYLRERVHVCLSLCARVHILAFVCTSPGVGHTVCAQACVCE
jgi:xanthine/uracil permease